MEPPRINTMESSGLPEPLAKSALFAAPAPVSTCARQLAGAQAKSTTTRTLDKGIIFMKLDCTPRLYRRGQWPGVRRRVGMRPVRADEESLSSALARLGRFSSLVC